MNAVFPECGCHYTTDDDGIHFCSVHAAAYELLEACKHVRGSIRGFGSLNASKAILDAAIAKAEGSAHAEA